MKNIKEENIFSTARRLISLYAFRGFTIIGMIIVNSPVKVVLDAENATLHD
jgi:predicted acyltransferase